MWNKAKTQTALDTYTQFEIPDAALLAFDSAELVEMFARIPATELREQIADKIGVDVDDLHPADFYITHQRRFVFRSATLVTVRWRPLDRPCEYVGGFLDGGVDPTPYGARFGDGVVPVGISPELVTDTYEISGWIPTTRRWAATVATHTTERKPG